MWSRRCLDAGVEPVALLPRVCWDRELPQLLRELETLKGLGVREAMAGTLDGVRRAVELGFLTRGDFGLGVYNSQTLKELKKLGLRSATASFELKLAQIRGPVQSHPAGGRRLWSPPPDAHRKLHRPQPHWAAQLRRRTAAGGPEGRVFPCGQGLGMPQ